VERSVRALLKEGESANTVRSYASALRYWAAWFRLHDGTLTHDLPPAVDHALVDNGFKGQPGAPALNTVLHRLSVVGPSYRGKLTSQLLLSGRATGTVVAQRLTFATDD
jgi:hypothetical protein